MEWQLEQKNLYILHRAKVICPNFFCAICQATFHNRVFDTRIKERNKLKNNYICIIIYNTYNIY